MPRASDGTVTLVAGNPVIAGTAISADVMNATLADIAAMLQDSLSRSGKGGLSVPWLLTKGTASAPALAFSGDEDTGVNSDTANQVDLVAGGSVRVSATTSGATVTGTLGVSGAATFDSTVGVTGVATFTATPVLTNGISGIRVADVPAAPSEIAAAATGSFSTASATDVLVSNQTILIDATGRPIIVMLVPEMGAVGEIKVATGIGGTGGGTFHLTRDGVDCGSITLLTPGTSSWNTYPSITFIDHTVTAGTREYKLYAKANTASSTVYVTNMVMVAWHL